jgi:hypothetical protein
MNRVNWTQVGVFVVVVLLVFLIGVSLLGGYGGGYGMMGGRYGIMGPGMMGGWGFAPFGWLGMIFMWIIPLGFLTLLVAGIVWLVRAATGGLSHPTPQTPPATGTCPGCGRSTQAAWQLCPYCGESLA